MQSKWYELKPAALVMRRNGRSIRFIETNLGVPRSTLSGWCKGVVLTEEQKRELAKQSSAGLLKARTASRVWHHEQKLARLKEAEEAAKKTLEMLPITPEILELALAMIYWGEGRKSQTTALGAADLAMLKFFITVIDRRFGVKREKISCELHLRHDQDAQTEIEYWSSKLNIPPDNFHRVYFDKRTRGTTYPDYHGVCLLYCSNIAIQRQLVYLYKSFCEKVIGASTLGD
jgi:hypothetical protein